MPLIDLIHGIGEVTPHVRRSVQTRVPERVSGGKQARVNGDAPIVKARCHGSLELRPLTFMIAAQACPGGQECHGDGADSRNNRDCSGNDRSGDSAAHRISIRSPTCIALTDQYKEEQYDIELVLRFLALYYSDPKSLRAFSDMDAILTERALDLGAAACRRRPHGDQAIRGRPGGALRDADSGRLGSGRHPPPARIQRSRTGRSVLLSWLRGAPRGCWMSGRAMAR
jgi:hypothetical protein